MTASDISTGNSTAGASAGGGQDAQLNAMWTARLRREARRLTTMAWSLRLLVAAIILISWQIVGQKNPVFTSYPTAVAKAAVNMIKSGELGSALGTSFRTLALGLVLSIFVGVGVGLIIGRYRLAAMAIEWVINALNATPLLAIIPIIIVWFGLGIESKVVIVFALTVFSMILNTATGVHEVQKNVLDVGRAFVASEGQVFRKIILPSAIPYIMTGLRISIGRALIGTVAAEFFTGVSGLGGLIQKYGGSYQTDYMLVPVLTLMLIGVVLAGVARWLETVVAPWRKVKR